MEELYQVVPPQNQGRKEAVWILLNKTPIISVMGFLFDDFIFVYVSDFFAAMIG